MVKPGYSSDSDKSSPESATSYKVQKRRIQKVVVERHRRDRINTALDSLKTMLHSTETDMNGEQELDKAQILEMTVSFLRAHQQRENPSPVQRRCSPTHTQSVEACYNTGYNLCLNHIQQNLAHRKDLPDHMRTRLLSHLSRKHHVSVTSPAPLDTPRSRRVVQVSSPMEPRKSAFSPVCGVNSYNGALTPNGNTGVAVASPANLSIEIPRDNHSVGLRFGSFPVGGNTASPQFQPSGLLAVAHPVPFFNMNQYAKSLKSHQTSSSPALTTSWRPW